MIRVFSFLALLWGTCAYATLTTDDTSGMNRTTVKEIIVMRADQTPQDLQKILQDLDPSTQVIVRGKRHSQGGHSIAQDGIVLDLSQWKEMRLIAPDVLRVDAGALWKDVIEYANTHKQSVDIMQSDYNFSVGGSLSTNVHGWEVGRAPFIDSVLGFQLMTSQGEILSCSRHKHPALFSAAIGGYGLLGIILSVDLRLVPNVMHDMHHDTTPHQDFLSFFQQTVEKSTPGTLFLARPRLDHAHYMEDLAVWRFTPVAGPPVHTPLVEHKIVDAIVRFIFERTYTSDFFRQLRWKLESRQAFSTFYERLPRNALLYQATATPSTEEAPCNDLLQEYLVPVQQFNTFYQFLKNEEPDLKGTMMNLTIRHVGADPGSLLKYATEPMFCFVLFLRGPKGEEFDAKAGGIARRCITKAQSLGGGYYLSHRPYATKDQFTKSYPAAETFKNLKKQYDPHEVFSNHFYQTYLK